jgi:hypothetical protein
VLIDAVAVVRRRWQQLADDTYAAIKAAQAAGTSQVAAMLANAMERARVDRILPHLPDNDLLNDRLRRSRGLPSELFCRLDDREVIAMGGDRR